MDADDQASDTSHGLCQCHDAQQASTVDGKPTHSCRSQEQLTCQCIGVEAKVLDSKVSTVPSSGKMHERPILRVKV